MRISAKEQKMLVHKAFLDAIKESPAVKAIQSDPAYNQDEFLAKILDFKLFRKDRYKEEREMKYLEDMCKILASEPKQGTFYTMESLIKEINGAKLGARKYIPLSESGKKTKVREAQLTSGLIGILDEALREGITSHARQIVEKCKDELLYHEPLYKGEIIGKWINEPEIKKILKEKGKFITYISNVIGWLSEKNGEDYWDSEDGEQLSMLDTVEGSYGGHKISFSNTESEDDWVLLLFEGEFNGYPDYLVEIEAYIREDRKGFYQDIEAYINKNKDTTGNDLRTRFKKCIKAAGKPFTKNDLAKLTRRVHNILDRMFSEHLVHYGGLKLKNTFGSVFTYANNQNNDIFLGFVYGIINMSYIKFQEDFNKLLTKNENTGEDSMFLERCRGILRHDYWDNFGKWPLAENRFPKKGLLNFSKHVYSIIKEDFKELLENYLYCFPYNITREQDNPKAASEAPADKSPEVQVEKSPEIRMVLDGVFFDIFCGGDARKKENPELRRMFIEKLITIALKIVEESKNELDIIGERLWKRYE
jgi:hypothetical protein